MTLASNRDLIADILDGLARMEPLIGWEPALRRGRLWRGADTLRWCDDFEVVNDCDIAESDLMVVQDLAETYEERLDKIGVVLTAWVADGMRKPAAFRDRVAALVAGKDDD
jgi:hypothetical protein